MLYSDHVHARINRRGRSVVSHQASGIFVGRQTSDESVALLSVYSLMFCGLIEVTVPIYSPRQFEH
jgi:hypothetical protein